MRTENIVSTVEIDPWVIALTAEPQVVVQATTPIDQPVPDRPAPDKPAPDKPAQPHGSQPSQHALAMWRLQEGDQPALALFSDEGRAALFARQLKTSKFQLLHPNRHGLISILIQVYRLNVQLAVLDPDPSGARRIFNVRDCLRAAKEQLISSESDFK